MKKTVIILAMVAALGVMKVGAQGTFNFSNFGTGVDAKVTDVDGVTALSGSAFKADAYWGPAGIAATDKSNSGLQSLGLAVSFSTGAGAGYFLGNSQAIPTQTGTVSLQVRVWQASAGATYAAAVTAGGHTGVGNVIQVALATGATGTPNMVGLQAFSLIVPEPSTIAMAAMGLGGLLIRRRK